jgi:hypothetical protein
MFLDKSNLKRCLFIDIETVAEAKSLDLLSERKQDLWKMKSKQFLRGNTVETIEPEDYEKLYIEKAGIFAEFAKVVCISMGFLSFESGEPKKIRIKSISGHDEQELLSDFSRLLINHYNDIDVSKICGHNIKEFDIPFLCRRMVINNVQFPAILDLSGKKPWQTTHLLDTMDMWRFGDYKNYTSLNLLAGTLNISSPKDDIDGSMVGQVYWEDEDIDRIVEYCQKDVVTVIQVVMRFTGLPLFSNNDIEYLNIIEKT